MKRNISPKRLSLEDFDDTFSERFWSKVKKTGKCWNWNGAHLSAGYGSIKTRRGGRMVLAHRAAWVLKHGTLDDGCLVCHDCPGGDNPKCVNPDHLFLGTHKDNTQDMIAKGRKVITSKLSSTAADQIRIRSANGESPAILSKEFGVTESNIYAIVRGETWKGGFTNTLMKMSRRCGSRRRREALAGEKAPSARLTWKIIRKIRKLIGDGVGPSEIARSLGMANAHIHKITSGQQWKDAGYTPPPKCLKPGAKVSEAKAVEIRKRYAAGEYQKDIARDYGVHQSLISMIVRRKIWQ